MIELLGRFGRVQPIVGMERPYHYRNKVQAAFALEPAGKIVSGVYQSSTHRVVPVETCLTEDETADEIIGTVRVLMKSFKLSPFDERTGRGLVRHVLVKTGIFQRSDHGGAGDGVPRLSGQAFCARPA